MKISRRIEKVKESPTLAITAKAKEMKFKGEDVVSFGAGEPDFDTPSHIKASAIKAIEGGFTKYTASSGIPELKKAICEKFLNDSGLSYEPSQIVVSCGAKHSLYNIFQAICDEGDEVIIPSPYWVSYTEMVKLAGGRPVILDTKQSDGFKVKPDALKKSITKKTAAFVLNSPSNPTGCVYNRSDAEGIADILINNKITVISDEIYEKLIYDGEKHISFASLSKEAYGITFTVNGMSKSYSMTGWRIGYLAAPTKELSAAVGRLQDHSTSNPVSFAQKAALEALKGDQKCVAEMVEEFKKRRDYMVDRINRMKNISCVKPKGAFYVFCDISKTKMGSLDFSKTLLEEAKVAVIPGEPFGWDTHIRLSFATGLDDIKNGLDRLDNWLKARE
ncbi:MAG: pyridoxal phosphate-dependent aminotransferase [Candidatus Omnitrophica bacterium]|nr:pyridoxal phosphate-dependent aminotransferase [Candidatus Omnitrophota bacterium]MDD5310661.1 pyridoxal phosphate-dependent aminotransferase [Candidatus Omnitrophota bacterium]MDD5545665.1 pyridoxal phosphate-dependent aminotransferase [Candidatus Omnitrophota bacterium]